MPNSLFERLKTIPQTLRQNPEALRFLTQLGLVLAGGIGGRYPGSEVGPRMLEALVRGEETRLQQEKLRQQNVIEQLRLLEDMRRQQALEEYWARQLSPKEIEKRQKARLKAAEEFEEEDYWIPGDYSSIQSFRKTDIPEGYKKFRGAAVIYNPKVKEIQPYYYDKPVPKGYYVIESPSAITNILGRKEDASEDIGRVLQHAETLRNLINRERDKLAQLEEARTSLTYDPQLVKRQISETQAKLDNYEEQLDATLDVIGNLLGIDKKNNLRPAVEWAIDNLDTLSNETVMRNELKKQGYQKEEINKIISFVKAGMEEKEKERFEKTELNPEDVTKNKSFWQRIKDQFATEDTTGTRFLEGYGIRPKKKRPKRSLEEIMGGIT